ncbi:alpha/beta fold hydrolase [Rhodococcus sp. NPDC058521]|uniref:alpha/beta fold hydrolase n=1 Tax=Rhodococcus sp. NPDC058521 TaxID=3346536 RepID=UPI003664AB77
MELGHTGMDRPIRVPTVRASSVSVLVALTLVGGSASASASSYAPFAPEVSGLRFESCVELTGSNVEGLECGMLEVPLSTGDPGAGTVHLAVSRMRATDPGARRGVLVVNPGGPGNTGLEYAATKGEKLPEEVRAAYDIIGFDPRGVAHSTVSRPDRQPPAPIDCGPMGGLFDRPVPSTGRLTALPVLAATARDCATEVGPDAAEFGTDRVADDIDAIRRALGEERISMLGVSYGTLIADRYARRYGAHVDRFVLDSVVGPGPDGRDDWHAFGVRQAEALLDQRNSMFGWWARHARHFGLGEDSAAVRRSYDAVRALSPSHGIGPDEFDRAVYRALGRTERWQPLGEALARARRDGDLAALAPVVPEVDDERRNAEAANRTVVCADATRPLSVPEVLAGHQRLERIDPQPILTGIEADVCAFWPIAALADPPSPPRSEVAPRLLMVAGAQDPVTPVADAERRHRQWEGSGMITATDTWSHGVFASQKISCVDDAVAEFLLGGASSDRVCTGTGLPEKP